jgi:uncharacterized tellurite resistance protein B-like protein
MTPEIEMPSGYRELLDRLNAPPVPEPVPDGGRRCHLHAVRHETTGQFYALSREDRAAFDRHCQALLEDLKPAGHRERWLAVSIAEDQWRLNRARALENNIFAIGMSGEISAATNADSPEVHAAVCQARVWLADGKNLQRLSLYEQRIRRVIQNNEKQLKELQAERRAAYDKALAEATLLAQLAIAEGQTCDPAEDFPPENGFGFSAAQITRLAHRELRLQKAVRWQKHALHGRKAPQAVSRRVPKAA